MEKLPTASLKSLPNFHKIILQFSLYKQNPFPNSPTLKSSLLLIILLSFSSLHAKTYTIGSGLTYEKLSQVSHLLDHGDTIFVQSGLYDNDSQVTISKDNIVVIGDEGGKPVLRAGSIIAGDFSNGKGIMVIKGNHVVVRNIIFENARVTDKNGAGIRQEACDLQIYNCVFRNNEMGILCGSYSDCKTTIEYCSFEGNGSSENPGYQHNVYINHIDTLIFRYNVTKNAVAEGHELKSRAKFNYIAYNLILNTESVDSRNIDLSNGGQAIIIGNVIEQSNQSANSNMIGFGLEGTDTSIDQALYMVNNTIVNRKSTGSFVQFPSGALDTIVMVNNAFCGHVTHQFLGNTSHIFYKNNAIGTIAEMKFKGEAASDFAITQNSPLKDHGQYIDQQIGAFSLYPEFEIHDENRIKERRIFGVIDIGAYEYLAVDDVADIGSYDYQIFPNPSHEILSCKACEDGIYPVFDGNGCKFSLVFNQHQADISSLKSGLYFLVKNPSMSKFIKL